MSIGAISQLISELKWPTVLSRVTVHNKAWSMWGWQVYCLLMLWCLDASILNLYYHYWPGGKWTGTNRLHIEAGKQPVSLSGHQLVASYHNDGDPPSHVSDYSNRWFLLGHHHCRGKQEVVTRAHLETKAKAVAFQIRKVDWVKWVEKSLSLILSGLSLLCTKVQMFN